MDDSDPAALHGTFETSRPSIWREFGVALAAGAGALGVLAWMIGEWPPVGFVVVALVAAILYALWKETQFAASPRRVVVQPGRVTVEFWNDERDDVLRTDLVDQRIDDGRYQRRTWVLQTSRDIVRIPDIGFSDDDSAHLTILLQDWKLQTGMGPMPGVAIAAPSAGASQAGSVRDSGRASEGDLVWEAQNLSAPTRWAVGVGFAALACGMAWATQYTSFGTEMQRDILIISILAPVSCFIVAGYAAFGFRASAFVSRARFGRDALTLDVMAGERVRVPYAAVRDAYGSWMDTETRTFFLGQKNADVFQTLLDERLQDRQLSGRRWLTAQLDVSAQSIAAVVAAIFVVCWAAWFALGSGGYLAAVLAATALSATAIFAHTRWTLSRVDAILLADAD